MRWHLASASPLSPCTCADAHFSDEFESHQNTWRWLNRSAATTPVRAMINCGHEHCSSINGSPSLSVTPLCPFFLYQFWFNKAKVRGNPSAAPAQKISLGRGKNWKIEIHLKEVLLDLNTEWLSPRSFRPSKGERKCLWRNFVFWTWSTFSAALGISPSALPSAFLRLQSAPINNENSPRRSHRKETPAWVLSGQIEWKTGRRSEDS